MKDDYYIDLENIDLDSFKASLESKALLPSRVVLRENLDQRFELLASMGIENLGDLWEALKTKHRVAQFADQSGLSKKYLTILRREISSYIPNPVNLSKLPGVDEQHIAHLEAVGIKTSKHLFDAAKTAEQRAELCQRTALPEEALLELVKLSDLARILGVGPVFARILYQAGVDRLETFLALSPDALLEKVNNVNESGQYTRVTLNRKDILYCFDTARLLPQAVEYD